MGTGYLISAAQVFGGGPLRLHLLWLLDGCHSLHSLRQNFNFHMSRIKSGFRRHRQLAHRRATHSFSAQNCRLNRGALALGLATKSLCAVRQRAANLPITGAHYRGNNANVPLALDK